MPIRPRDMNADDVAMLVKFYEDDIADLRARIEELRMRCTHARRGGGRSSEPCQACGTEEEKEDERAA